MSKTIEEAAKIKVYKHLEKMFGFVALTNAGAQNMIKRTSLFYAIDVEKIAVEVADFALSRQWRSVEDELPEDDTLVAVHSPNGRVEILHYYDDVFQDELKQAHCVDYWMPIPKISSLNPEQ